MKKILIYVVIGMYLLTLCGCNNSGVYENESELEIEELDYDSIKDKLVRFHVIANSDTEEDQELKLKVRDAVIAELSEELENVKELDEAKSVLEENIDNINILAKSVIKENNYDYSVNTMLSNENFPDKIYGDYLFPQGAYEAYRIIIGEGKGQNWWCVMFPPLCFVDESKEVVDNSKLEDNIKEIEDQNIESQDMEDNNQKNKSNNDIVFKFKFLEKLKEMFN